MTNKPSYWVVIPAAGIGSRMNADRPKQYLPLSNKLVIEHSLALFLQHQAIAGVVVVMSPQDQHWTIPQHPKLYRCDGGPERSDSVLNGLNFLAQHAAADDWVMVHDAARPLLPLSDLDKLISHLDRKGNENGALLAAPLADTLKKANTERGVETTISRSQLWRAQTPQVAMFSILRKALLHCVENNIAITDDASALEAIGLQPTLIQGSARNFKITEPDDLVMAEALLSK